MSKKQQFFYTVLAYAIVGGVVSFVGAIMKKKDEERTKAALAQTEALCQKMNEEMMEMMANFDYTPIDDYED